MANLLSTKKANKKSMKKGPHKSQFLRRTAWVSFLGTSTYDILMHMSTNSSFTESHTPSSSLSKGIDSNLSTGVFTLSIFSRI